MFISVIKDMKKGTTRRKKVEEKLERQEVMTIEDIEAHHLSFCHPDCTGIGAGSRSHYVSIHPEKAKALAIPTVREFSATTTGMNECRGS